jgi:hypothetical protein
METKHKPFKIRAGRYNYRGIIIRKREGRDFVYTVTSATGWRHGGLRTLGQAITEIDERLASGDYEIRHASLHQLTK